MKPLHCILKFQNWKFNWPVHRFEILLRLIFIAGVIKWNFLLGSSGKWIHLAHPPGSSKKDRNFYPKISYPYSKKILRQNFFHIRLKEPVFYSKKVFLYLPEKITKEKMSYNYYLKKQFSKQIIYYTCFKKKFLYKR